MGTRSGTRGAAFERYAEAVDWITRKAPAIGIRPGLKRMERFMEKLGHPEHRLKFIHVAGTNGKGSTCAFLTKALRKSGYDVGTFTSPYIRKFTDRLQYNEQDIEEEQVLRLANEIRPLAEEMEEEFGAPSMFEITTVMAILYFAKVVYPDFVVFETGLGGRLDSTNIVTPLVSVITNIGHDHMELLGGTIGLIAAEKAGIIKAGVPVVTGVQQPEAMEAIEQVCRDKKSALYRLGSQFHFDPVSTETDAQALDFTGPFRSLRNIRISLNGYHQFHNAAVALMTLEVLRQYYAVLVEEEDLAEAFGETRWPGRLELVSEAPRVLLDGAHNPEGAEALAAALRQNYRYDKLHVLAGMLSTKDHSAFFGQLLPLADMLIVTEPDFFKKLDAAELAGRVRDIAGSGGFRTEIVTEPDWKTGLGRLLEMTGPNDLAVVTGTLYLISDVRSWMLYRTDSEKGW